GELAVEETVENLLGKPYPESDDWLIERRVERRQQVVLMVDTSRSMAGPNLALAATATAVLALKLHPGDLALVAFAAQARSLSSLDDSVPAASLVRRLLAQSCTGPTNIAAALELGVAELERGRNPHTVGLLISDGVYTAGSDPLRAAARFSHLHVLLTADAAVDRHAVHGGWLSPRRIVGHAVARAGGGHVIAVDGFADLPQRMCDVADRVLR
ncbi:MAG: vWA domain-containing protein, partial [Thermoleophilia bacterium]